MPDAQVAWVAGLLALPLVTLLIFMRSRRKSGAYFESRLAKARLPWWVKNVETLLALVFGYVWAVAGLHGYAKLLGKPSIANAPLSGAEAVYVVVGLGLIILPMAMLSANAISSIIPFLRKANQDAFRGTTLSFGAANAGLIKFAAVSVPFGVAALVIAARSP